jgi:hypothetical protein
VESQIEPAPFSPDNWSDSRPDHGMVDPFLAQKRFDIFACRLPSSLRFLSAARRGIDLCLMFEPAGAFCRDVKLMISSYIVCRDNEDGNGRIGICWKVRKSLEQPQI